MARKRRGQIVNGWLIIDKPAGLTSAAVVGRVRRMLDVAKIGHGGTLDPLATGVLPLALGEATKTVSYVMNGAKGYRFTARWGEARIIVAGLGMLIVAIVLQPVLRLPAASVALMAALMVGHSLAFPNAGALVSRNTPPDRQGSVMGLNMASNALSRIVGPPLFGWVFSVSADLPYYVCALMIAAMLPVAWGVVRRTNP